MRHEDALLYLCCTQDLPTDRFERFLTVSATPRLDWHNVFTLAHEHGVAPLVYQNLQAALETGTSIPAEVIQRFKLATYQNLIAKQKQAERLVYTLAYLQECGIDAMILKGAALDLAVYAHPWYTVAHDVDLVLRSRGSGWCQNSTRELEIRLCGLGIEYDFECHHDVTLNGALPIDFGLIWRDAVVMDLGGYPVYHMAPEDMLLAVCINSCRKRYFRLRSLCDIAETSKRFPTLDWTLFIRKALCYGCSNIVYTALQVTDATVTSPVPRWVLDDLAVSTPRRMMIDKTIEYLIHHVPLTSLSYYTGSKWIGRKVGWSLVLPYLTYRWQQMGSKVHEALTTYFALHY